MGKKILIILFVLYNACLSFAQRVENKQTKILIETDFGSIKIRLYNETPLHRDNFIKLVKEHYYDSLLFHRVIQHFMIQGGDPDSKYADSTKDLGNGGPSYTIPAEFNPKLFHKKGVLAAARDNDLENPTQTSSGSQFYIVQGNVFTDSMLQQVAKKITEWKLFNTIINRKENKHFVEEYQQVQRIDGKKAIMDTIYKIVQQELPYTKPYMFTPEQIKAYKTIGGTPHLDGSYTVFGEVYEGLEVVDKIAAQKTNTQDRPLKEIRMKISMIKKE